MKIALFDNQATLGGAQRALLDLAYGLQARHWETIAILGSDGPLCRAFEQMNIPVIHFPLPRSVVSLKNFANLVRLCRQEQIRQIYTMSSDAALLSGLVMRWLRGQVYWRPISIAQLPQRSVVTHVCVRLCTRCFTANAALTERVRQMAGALPAIQQIPQSINLDRYPLHASPGQLRGARPVIGMVGTWEAATGHDIVIKAFRMALEHGHAARLRIASLVQASPDKKRYLAMLNGTIRASGLADRIIIEGEIHDLPGFLSRCDLVVAPFQRQTTGRLALEVAAAGRPMIASRDAGMNEIIEDGHTGLLVPCEPQALSDAMALLLASPALRTEMGRQARIRVEKHFSIKRLLDALTKAMPNEQLPSQLAQL